MKVPVDLVYFVLFFHSVEYTGENKWDLAHFENEILNFAICIDAILPITGIMLLCQVRCIVLSM